VFGIFRLRISFLLIGGILYTRGASIIRLDGPTIHPDILIPLIFMWLGFINYLISVLIIRIQSEITQQKIRALQIMISNQK
jgi:hypothetical protein